MKVTIYNIIRTLVENSVNGYFVDADIMCSTTDREKAERLANDLYNRVLGLNKGVYDDSKLLDIINNRLYCGGGYVKLINRNGELYKKIEIKVETSELEIG